MHAIWRHIYIPQSFFLTENSNLNGYPVFYQEILASFNITSQMEQFEKEVSVWEEMII